MKKDFDKFTLGTIFNSVELQKPPNRHYESLTIRYPSRLEAMALDPARIADNNNLVYEAGQIDITVALYKTIRVEVDTQTTDITISATTPRQQLARHAALIMRHALGVSDGWKIDVIDTLDMRHCGLGSSSGLIAGVASAINELYGKPLSNIDLVRYCAQNHGEEIDDDPERLTPVQCIGGSAVCGNFEGGLIVLAGQATPIFTSNLPEDLRIVIGIPNDYTHPDSQELMQAEIDNMGGFKTTGDTYGPRIAYRLVHEVFPDLAMGKLKPCKDLIFDYRWDMGSIQNCSFVYPRMLSIAEELRPLKDDPEVIIISLSSVGPGFFALTTNPEKLKDIFIKLDLTPHLTKVHNGTYSIEDYEESKQ